MKLLSENWGNKLCWEISLPGDWNVSRDKAYKENPYVIEFPCGDKLSIKTSKLVTLHGYDFSIAPKELTFAQQQVFMQAAQDAGNENTESPTFDPESGILQSISLQLNALEDCRKRTEQGAKKLEKLKLGVLFGFVFSPSWGNGIMFKRGYFSYEPWTITVALQSPDHRLKSWEAACTILSSISFNEDNSKT